ncbi:MAG: thioredoxin reductase [Fusobacteriales bacterium]|nr:MAG: thioredoxin reductase [Fusobacteriales bacterium]
MEKERLEENEIYDVIIVGAGPAGLTAGLYASRGNLKTLILEKTGIGTMLMTHRVDNYPGFKSGSTGEEIYNFMKAQALEFGCEIKPATVLGFDPYEEIKIVKTDNGNFKTKYIVIATGIGKIGTKKLKGVSYCATCDGAFTRGRISSLVGKGDEIVEEALFLTRFSKEVNIYLTTEELDCNENLKAAILEKENAKIITNCELVEIKGNEEAVEELCLKVNGVERIVKTDFVFLYLGTKTNLELFGEFTEISKSGCIITDENMETRTKKMYAIGDIREKNIRQITTATSDGTIAATMILKDVLKAKKN